MGLRVIFGLVVLGFTVSTGQVAFYGVRGQGLFANEIGGPWAIPSYVTGYVAIMLGGFRLRRPFTLVAAALCLYSIPVTAFLNWPLLQVFWQDLLSGRMSLARVQTWETWCFIWNNICLSIDAGILLYLLSYEFRLFGPGRMRTEMS
jgi:hypothetical protein